MKDPEQMGRVPPAEPADAGKGDLLYPVPDPTPGVEVHGRSPWKGTGSSGEVTAR